MNQEPIFLLGAHKSGTSLLRSIFDGHSKLFVIPIEAHFFPLTGYWVEYEYWKQKPTQLSTDKIVEKLTSWITTCNNAEDRLSDSVAKGIFNVQHFKNHISELTTDANEKIRIERYFESIYFSLFGKAPSENLRIVEKSVENPEVAVYYQKIFPKAKFIHIVRNPYANIVSLRKFKSVKYGYPLMPRVIRTLQNSYYYLYKNQQIIENYKVIKYEALVENPRAIIADLCDFLSIDFEDTLMTPSFLGKPWSGNSTTGKLFKGIEASNLNRWQQEIYPMEVFFINKLFRHVLHKYGYKIFEQSGSFWRRAKNENLQRYIYNRLYRYYCE